MPTIAEELWVRGPGLEAKRWRHAPSEKCLPSGARAHSSLTLTCSSFLLTLLFAQGGEGVEVPGRVGSALASLLVPSYMALLR